MRFGQQRVQLERLLRGGAHFPHFIGNIEPELTRPEYVGRGETCISGGKGWVFGDRFLERPDAFVVARQAALNLQGARAKVEIVGFGAGLVTAAAAAKLQSQAVDDAAGNLVLDGEDIGSRSGIPARPQRDVVAHPDQLGIDPQLPAGAKDRTFQNVIGLQLFSRLTNIAWLAFKDEGRGLGANGQTLNDGQVADDLAGEAIGKVVVGGVLIQVDQGQDCDRNRRGLVMGPPPGGGRQGQREAKYYGLPQTAR